MKLLVYKGFDHSFLKKLKIRPLVEGPIEKKTNVLAFDRSVHRKLGMAFYGLGEEIDTAWVTYEEYALIRDEAETEAKKYGLNIVFYLNNVYPEYYPIPFPISEELFTEIQQAQNDENNVQHSEACTRFFEVYNSLIKIGNVYYGSFYNYEYEYEKKDCRQTFYTDLAEITESAETGEFNIFLNGDMEIYLRDFEKIKALSPATIGVRAVANHIAKRTEEALRAYCGQHGIRLVHFSEKLPDEARQEEELIKIAREDIKIPNFKEFRTLKFYKNPDINKEIVNISQAQIIGEIIRQAENSYNPERGNRFRDIFITAPTGAGKSVMFQIPAIYLAKKYHKLTIVIEPVKALMQDQKEKLTQSGFSRVAVFNSDLITQVEKEAVLKRVKEGEVDLLYLSPETLLSYSIENIIGNRELGLIIVDEAHIVTTWGVGFRPDYWYLGGYINRLRSQIQTTRGKNRKIYHFPVCAFTATAINGGPDDSVSETVISLYMENPIKYIGYARRNNIQFEITHPDKNIKASKGSEEQAKAHALKMRIEKWLGNNEKTIVYFPFASLARDAKKGIRSFGELESNKRIGLYIGRNIDNDKAEAFNSMKNKNFEEFRCGKKAVMFATKAFGMGVDIDDIQNVYHYAITGNLCDYMQEIGRAARKPYMTGHAIMDVYGHDKRFMNSLFGMSQIRQYQIGKVIEGIYHTYASKGESRNFLISPESFTYIFNGKGAQDEASCINKLKTCLLMLEKDFYDKYNFKVLISRPRGIFTKAFVCIRREYESQVRQSKYADCFEFAKKGRDHEVQADGTYLSDVGDIYVIDLKKIWERHYPNLSFPQFKYYYFSNHMEGEQSSVMPEIRSCIMPRQQIHIAGRQGIRLNSLREQILEDFEYIADQLYSTYNRQFFTIDDFVKLLKEKYGNTKARVIGNSIFDLVDPNSSCVKRRGDENGKTTYSLARGDFKELMRRFITKSQIMNNLSVRGNSDSYSGYVSLETDETSMVALKLLSVFDYITYEVLGGSEPEIFIRLNDPQKFKDIALGKIPYSNTYVRKARERHERDIKILSRFINKLSSDTERWDYIEDYFLGRDVLGEQNT